MDLMGMLDDRWEAFTFGMFCAFALSERKENETQMVRVHGQLLRLRV
jgi:hypothetical protein